MQMWYARTEKSRVTNEVMLNEGRQEFGGNEVKEKKKKKKRKKKNGIMLLSLLPSN